MVLLDPVSLLDGVVGTSMGLGVRAEMVGGKVLQRWASRCEEGGVSRWEVEVEGGNAIQPCMGTYFLFDVLLSNRLGVGV